MNTIECGAAAAEHFACSRAGYRNLNHASYGTYPLALRDVLHKHQDQVETRPDVLIRYENREKLLNESRAAIAEYVHAPVECCVLVPNTSYAIDAVLRNLVYSPDDHIISFSSIYGAFANTLQYLSETTPVRIQCIDYTLPVSDDFLCEAFTNVLTSLKDAGKNPHLAIFDTVNSLPGVRMPFERLVKICKEHRVLSIVDGAHGIGMIPLNLTTLDADFFASNCHKWLYTPRASALLFVPERNQHLLRATFPTSFGFGHDFVSNFASIGTLDDTPHVCLPAAIEWRKRLTWGDKVGEEAIIDYMTQLARKGGQLVANVLGTEVLENAEGRLGECSMTNVRLPLFPKDIEKEGLITADEVGRRIMRSMIVEHSTAVNVFVNADALWVRLSAPIYLTIEDFEHTANLLLRVCEAVKAGG